MDTRRAIQVYRCGDFLDAYGANAERLAEVLGIALVRDWRGPRASLPYFAEGECRAACEAAGYRLLVAHGGDSVDLAEEVQDVEREARVVEAEARADLALAELEEARLAFREAQRAVVRASLDLDLAEARLSDAEEAYESWTGEAVPGGRAAEWWRDQLDQAEEARREAKRQAAEQVGWFV